MRSRSAKPEPNKGCNVGSAVGCYGKAGVKSVVDVVFDGLIGPLPSDSFRRDSLILYYGDPANSASEAMCRASESLCSQTGDYEGPSLAGFIREEGLDVLLRTGQSVGGAGQVLLGGTICYASGSTACVAGIAIAAKGLDNFRSGLSGEQSVAEEALIDITGSETAGTLINAGLDLGTSVYGLTRAVPIARELGTKATVGVRLFRSSPIDTEAAFRQATRTSLAIGAFSDTATILDATQVGN
jgi:hypothetical protein